MKIVSFNTQHCLDYIEKKIDFQAVADAIKSMDADIVGLNEMRGKGTRADFEDQTAILSELTGMKYYYFAKAIDVGGENPYGNALISKYPILSAETILVPDPDPREGNRYYETRCLLKAKLDCGITVLIIHFGLNRDEQKNAVATVLDHIENEKCILMGDFNVTPENDVLDPIRKRMKDTAELFGEPQLSFPSDKPDRKIDYIFVSPDVEVIAADIPAVVVSDHRPHTATVSL